MGPDLRLTAIHSPGLSFNGGHPRDPRDNIGHYSFTDPAEGWSAELAWCHTELSLHRIKTCQ